MAASCPLLLPSRTAFRKAFLLAIALVLAFGPGFARDERAERQDALFATIARGLDASRSLEKALPSSLRADGQGAVRPFQDRPAGHAFDEALSPPVLPASHKTCSSPGAPSLRESFGDSRRLDSVRPRSPPVTTFHA